MLKKLLFAPILTAICAAELVSIANYTGKHDSNCMFQQTVTGAVVNDKLYTFGGCFKIPYVVDPNDSRESYISYVSRQNTTDLSQVYDIFRDAWSFETKTPIPIKHAATQVVNKTIYFFDMKPEKRYSSMGMYKYDTESKSWTTLPEIPFLWHGNLKSCYDGRGKVYFVGSYDGQERNIVQILDTTNDQWSQSPIFMDKRLDIWQMICNQDHIKFIAKDLKKIEDEDTDRTVWYGGEIMSDTLELFSTSYLDGTTVSDNYTFSLNYGSGTIGRLGSWIFVGNVGRTETTFYRLNTMTQENVTMATLPYNLAAPLIAPVNEREILILGGSKQLSYDRTHRNAIKNYNHKLIYTPRKYDEL
ncbi:G2/mitotic-specific cyclin [Mucor velutinosus]|uniref:G2/mitotic-specific cyclin n=1 Tax=Mucor velutinosus TaxID=708070 RepID=A0AAN7D8S8_9FUNG|nr:G2/mitotic-specific cyclin [Mucor velutinosus]